MHPDRDKFGRGIQYSTWSKHGGKWRDRRREKHGSPYITTTETRLSLRYKKRHAVLPTIMYPNMALRGTALLRECCKAVTFQRIQKGESIEGKKGMFFLIHPWLCCYDSLICICFKVYIFDKLRVNLVQVAVILITTTWTDQVWESRTYHIKISEKLTICFY